MQLPNILTVERTYCDAPGSSKKRLLETISEFICNDISAFDAEELFQRLKARERLGSTGIGHGIAIPHCRVPNCITITGALFKLKQAIDFDAIDNQPVDLFFVLLVPEEACDQHLQALSLLAEQFNNQDYCQSLRDASSNQELFDAAINIVTSA
ncbi:phosphotransferase IIA-like nitrogen-regulatory protein PtsN [Sinobacterium caligoides]|uniref:Phosphotransferase IIA-like nitrogen-regulatory protein PtsN n=1 Tax=Sinobacterium caligoides TaxID=933926 RepID=A0A3N2E1Y2_9GAMM|nr:PTS IIA-like nitrogen regulatory protein PtsN [Sinobacterium caligoides]ROS06116.1 phosphotransferase IIA-like nitrogen-regulatory protein PtsN [Sinobacterium caligoides]